MNKIFLIILFIILTFLIAFNVHAQIDSSLSADFFLDNQVNDIFWGGHQNTVNSVIGLGSFDPRIMIANIINYAMGFLGILAVSMIMLAGFKIMVSGGNEDKVGEAKKMLFGTLMGAFLILASFGIAKFFLGALTGATGIT